MRYKNFEQVIAYRCKKCGLVVQIPSSHVREVEDVTAVLNEKFTYSLGLNITDENGKEISDDTKIKIVKVKPYEDVIQLKRIFYKDVKMEHHGNLFKPVCRFKYDLELNGEDHLQIYIVQSKCNIPSENIKFKLESDSWNRNSQF